MKIVYRYIIRNFLGPLILTFFVAIFILLMQFLWKYVDDLVGKGLEIHILLKFMFYAAGSLMSMATTSKRSPILPKVISDANRIANGSAMLISEPAA